MSTQNGTRSTCHRRVFTYIINARTSDASRHQQNDDDNDNQPQATAWAVAPASAVRPRRNCSKKKQDQNDEQNGSRHFYIPLSRHRGTSLEVPPTPQRNAESRSYDSSSSVQKYQEQMQYHSMATSPPTEFLNGQPAVACLAQSTACNAMCLKIAADLRWISNRLLQSGPSQVRPCIHPGAAVELGCFPGVPTLSETPQESALIARLCVRICARAGNPGQSAQAAQLAARR